MNVDLRNFNEVLKVTNKKKSKPEIKDPFEEEIQKEIDIFKYVQGLSEKKQVALLHSALSGKLNSEGSKFLSSVYFIKKKKVYK